MSTNILSASAVVWVFVILCVITLAVMVRNFIVAGKKIMESKKRGREQDQERAQGNARG